MPNLSRHCGDTRLFVKRDDCTGLAFGGNKVRQLEFYLGEALSNGADTLLITGAVQSNFVRTTAAAASKLGLKCHIQLEERVADGNQQYRTSGNVLLDKMFGATMHSFSVGNDEEGADREVQEIANGLKAAGSNPYIIPLSPGHPPLGALGYVVAAAELLQQIGAANLDVETIYVGSGSGATHGGLLFGLRALGSSISVKGVCVRRAAELQFERIRDTCSGIADLLDMENVVADEDIELNDEFLAPGYGVANDAVLDAMLLGARLEGLIADPVYTGKALAAFLHDAREDSAQSSSIFIHTGGTPAVFAYQSVIETAINRNLEQRPIQS